MGINAEYMGIVERLGKRLGVDLDEVFTLNNVDEDASKKHPFPCPCSYRTALSHYLDIMNPPRTHVLGELAEYASDPADKEKLQKMSSATDEGKAMYVEWIANDHRDILAVLEDLPSLMPPLDHLAELLPRLQPRYYSISSTPKVYPKSIHVTAVVLEYTTRAGRDTQGVCTSWLQAMQADVQGGGQPCVPIFVRKSQFRLPFKPST